jgi:hypothetical protein
MTDRIIQVAPDFWNVRGVFRIAGLVDIGTQASLVRLKSGNFLFLDSYTADEALREELHAITGGAGEIEAIVNLHPFHTVHVERMHQMYPAARLHGTRRHLALFPDLPWEPVKSEDTPLHQLYADDFEFSIPRGVDFISGNEHVHCSSVMAYHRDSRTIHVDDTLMYIVLPRLLRLLGLRDSVAFHPTLAMALEKRPGAAAEFRAWAGEIIEQWGAAENLCAAHSGVLSAKNNRGNSIRERMCRALRRSELWLRAHEKRYG